MVSPTAVATMLRTRLSKPLQPPRVRPAPPSPPSVVPPVRPSRSPAPSPSLRSRLIDAIYSPSWVPAGERKSTVLGAMRHSLQESINNPRMVGLDRTAVTANIPRPSSWDVRYNPKTWLNNIPRLFKEDIPGLFRGSEKRPLDKLRHAAALTTRRAPWLALQYNAAKGTADFAASPTTPEAEAMLEVVRTRPQIIPKALVAGLLAGGEAVIGTNSKGSPTHSAMRDTLRGLLGWSVRATVGNQGKPSGTRLLAMTSLPGAARVAVGKATDSALARAGVPEDYRAAVGAAPGHLLRHSSGDPQGVLADTRGETWAGSTLRDALAASPRAAALYANRKLFGEKE